MVKRLIISTLCLFFWTSATAYAGGYTCENSPIYNAIANECVDHPTAKKQRFGQIIEGKTKLYKVSDNIDINGKIGHDTANGHSAATVQLDYKTEEGILQVPIDAGISVGKKILTLITFGIFDKGE